MTFFRFVGYTNIMIMTTSKVDLDLMTEILSYRRADGSRTHRKFCENILEPVFGQPDEHGNYVLAIGDNPRVCFTAHSDTCHWDYTGNQVEGTQQIDVGKDKVIQLSLCEYNKDTSRCLGADDGAGIWLILGMIRAGIEGYYAIFASEETGGHGSYKLKQDGPDWLMNVDFMLSLDRAGYDSLVTHQGGVQGCSFNFGKYFEDALNSNEVAVLDYKCDSTGVFTDSANFTGDFPNVINLSVGYFRQHTRDEWLDFYFTEGLLDVLISLDWADIAAYSKKNPAQPV